MATGGSINTDILSDETFDLLCTICKRKGTNREAEKYCVECNDYYCITCVKVHEDVPLLSGHKILDQGQVSGTTKKSPKGPHGSGQGQPVAPTERCDRHNHYYIDMYCQNHDNVGCVTCMAVEHRSCKDTFYIPEFLQNNQSVPASKETHHVLEGVAKSLTKYYDDLQHHKQQLLKAKAESLENIRKLRKEINDRLDKLEQNSLDEIESIYNALINEIEAATTAVQTNKTNIRSAKDNLSSPGNNVSQVFVNVKKGNQIAKTVSKCTEDNKALMQLVDIEFKADQKLPALLEEINTLGRITERNVLFRVTGKKKYSVKLLSDVSDCSIVSACTLEDGTIILSDNKNRKLKRLDSFKYTVTDYCDLPGRPWQPCPISNQEIAVCLPGEQAVQFISVGSRLTKTKQIKTKFSCYGLAYANGNLYISDADTSVYIYSVSGSKLKQFSKDPSGQELFSDICSLAVSKDGLNIYISDCKKGLIVLDKNGQINGQFRRSKLDWAFDCCLTDTGSLFVCGRESHNVLQFGPDGRLIGEIVKSEEKACYLAVCCNRQLSKMVVGSESNHNIEVYDLA